VTGLDGVSTTPVESFILTVKAAIVAVVGVPERTPVLAFKLSPEGNEPLVITQFR
jgi:hypothetical protein